MDRRKTILIAVLINIGLLCLLLVAAIDFQKEECLLTNDRGGEELSKNVPLFSETNDISLPPPLSLNNLPLGGSLTSLSSDTTDGAEIVHKLPAFDTPEVLTPVVKKEKPVLSHPKNTLEISVKKGDTLEKIARRYHTTVDQIIQVNQLPSSFLRVGQQLKIPIEKKRETHSVSKTGSLEKTSKNEYYIVKVGDNPWAIAMKHHMKVDELLKMNDLNEEKARKLKPGDRLRIR